MCKDGEYVQRYRKVWSLALCICIQRYNRGKEKKVEKVKKEKKEEEGTEKTKSDKNKESNFKHRSAM